jgi:dethiobiotin synthetase
MNGEVWRGKRIFLTGHTGFKGSWLSLLLEHLGAVVTGYALAPATQPSMFALANVAEGMQTSYLADIVAQYQWPVLLVVGMKLGCLNHAMLTYRELERAGVPLIGWVANQIDADMLKFEENLADLTARLPIPLLSVLPYQVQGATAEQSLQLAQTFISANAARQS